MRHQLKRIEGRKLVSVLASIMTLLMLFQNCGDAYKALPLEKLNLATSTPKYAVFVASDQNVASKESVQNFSLTVDPAHASEIIAYYCQLDEAAPKVCGQTFTLSDLSERNHRLKVEGKNSSGTTIAFGSYDFTVDKTGPVVTFVQAPGAVAGTSSANFTFSSVDALSRVGELKCSLDNAAYATVPSPYVVSNLTEGTHDLKCQVSDEIGNLSAVVERTWFTSLSAPGLMLGAGLPAFTGATAQVSFSATTTTNSAIVTTCSLDNAAFEPCVTGKTYVALAAGNHTVVVKAKDTFNRESMASYTWMVDLTAPTVRLTSTYGPYTNLTSIPLAFVSEDPMGAGGGSCECGMGADAAAAAFSTCASPYTIAGTVEGVKTAFVRCRDVIGNLSVPVRFQVTVDRTPPTLVYTSDVKFVSSNRDANFTFAVSEAIAKPARVQTSLNDAAFTDTPLSYPLRNLGDGRYSLRMRAIDDAGNTSNVQSISWTVDTLPPEAPKNIKMTARSSPDSVVWDVAVDAGGIASYEVQVGTQPGLADLVPRTVVSTNSYPIPYNLQRRVVNGVAEAVFERRVSYVSVRATDTLGNVGPWGNSGPTNPMLYSDLFPYRPVCGFGSGACLPTERLVTDEATLNAGTIKTEKYIGVSNSSVIRIGSAFRNDSLMELISQSPGVLTSSCNLEGVSFACDMVDRGSMIPGLNFDREQNLEVTIFYNGEEFYKTKFLIELVTSAFPLNVRALQTVTTSSAIVYGKYSYGDVFNPMKTVWVENGGYANFNYICWTSPTEVQTRLVVREGGVMITQGAVNPFQDCKVHAYVDAGARLYLGSGVVEELTVSPGSKVYFQTSFGSARILKLNRATQAIPPVASCPYSPTGACPTDTVEYR